MSRLGRLVVGSCVVATVLLIPRPAMASDLVITNPPPSPVTPHVPFSHQFVATGGIAPYTFSIDPSGGDITAGLALSPAGLLSGTPDVPGTWIFTVLVTDSFGDMAALDVTMLVNPPVITLIPPQSSIPALQELSHTMATGGKAPYTLSKISGDLPAGMVLMSPGLLFGIPQELGSFTFKVRATDAQGFKSSDATFTFVVVPPTIVVGPAPPSPIYTGQPLSHTFTVTGALGTKTISLFVGALPPGLSLTSAGVLSGTPTTVGAYPVTIQGTTTFGPLTFSGYLDRTIVVVDPAVAFTSPAPPGGVVKKPYSFAFTADGDSGITFSLVSGALPPGLVLAGDGLLSGTPAKAGEYSFVVKATGAGSSAEQDATIRIASAETIANTGQNNVGYVVVGGLLILAGLVLMRVARRPRTSEGA